MSKYSKLEHEGDEFYEENEDIRLNHKTRSTIEKLNQDYEKLEIAAAKKARERMQREWLSPENPFIWDPIIDY